MKPIIERKTRIPENALAILECKEYGNLRNVKLKLFIDNCPVNPRKEYDHYLTDLYTNEGGYKIEKVNDDNDILELYDEPPRDIYHEFKVIGIGYYFVITQSKLVKEGIIKPKSRHSTFIKKAKSIIEYEAKEWEKYVYNEVYGYILDWEEKKYNGNNPVFQDGKPYYEEKTDSCCGIYADDLETVISYAQNWENEAPIHKVLEAMKEYV